MELGPQILVYTAWLVVAIAACGATYMSLARRDFHRDRDALSRVGAGVGTTVARGASRTLQSLRDRYERLTPMTRAEFQDQKALGVRVTLYLGILTIGFAGYKAREDWLLMVLAYGSIYVAICLPISVAHSFALRFLRARGILISIATGSFLGLALTSGLKMDEFVKPAVIWGAVYGLIIGLGNTAIFAPGLVADDHPRTLEEQAKADGL